MARPWTGAAALVVVALVVGYLMQRLALPEQVQPEGLQTTPPPQQPPPQPHTQERHPAAGEDTAEEAACADEPEEPSVELVCDEAALLAWLRDGGAIIHPGLALRPPETAARPASGLRVGDAEVGVFAAAAIGPAELLFSVPEVPFAL